MLGLQGWVRNLPDGRVELVAEGPRDVLERMIAWCHEGPRMSRVASVDVSWDSVCVDDARASGFQIAR